MTVDGKPSTFTGKSISLRSSTAEGSNTKDKQYEIVVSLDHYCDKIECIPDNEKCSPDEPYTDITAFKRAVG